MLKLKDDSDIEDIVTFTYILMKQYFTEKPQNIPKVLRLGAYFAGEIVYYVLTCNNKANITAFHACIGGCDGSVVYNDPGNAGLQEFIEECYIKVFVENGVNNVMTFMDFLTYSTYAAIDHSIEINNRDCSEAG